MDLSNETTRMRLTPAILVSVAALAGCSTHRGGYQSEAAALAACREVQDCASLELKPGVVLTPVEACWVSILRERCDVYDHCILKCLLNGEARDIAGGCWHVCGNIIVMARGKPLLCPSSAIPGWEKCEELRAQEMAESCDIDATLSKE